MQLQEIINIQPTENGIIELVIEGQPRRFVKEKLISYLRRNGEPGNTKRGEHKRIPVIAITPDNKELSFKSSAEAAEQLGICRSNIPHALSGKYAHVNGYRFKYANTN